MPGSFGLYLDCYGIQYLSSRNHGQIIYKLVICINSDLGLFTFIYHQTDYLNSSNLGIRGRRSRGNLITVKHTTISTQWSIYLSLFNLLHYGILRFQLKYFYCTRKKATRKKRINVLPLQLILHWLRHLLFLLSINLLCVPYITIKITSGSFMKSLKSYYPLISLSAFQYFLRCATWNVLSAGKLL